MVAIDGLLDPEAGETLLTALDPLARPTTAEDQRSGPQRRADALTELASLLGQHTIGGQGAWVGPLPAETARRLACDGAVTRVLVTRDRPTQDEDGDGLAARLRAAIGLLPRALGGAPTQPLEVGRATRVLAPAQRTALGVRDGGCVFPGCDRPPGCCQAHHLRHWLHGGATDLGNLVLLCRAHHRAVHEGGWRLQRHPDGELAATPPHPRQPVAA